MNTHVYQCMYNYVVLGVSLKTKTMKWSNMVICIGLECTIGSAFLPLVSKHNSISLSLRSSDQQGLSQYVTSFRYFYLKDVEEVK